MNYSRIYEEIIANAKSLAEERTAKKNNHDEYFETHHIIPKSSGGTDDKENLVTLTAREHFICHWLLYKIHPTKENAFSWWMMSNNEGNKYHKNRKRQSSRKYEYARKVFSKHISEVHAGKSLSESHREKISKSKMGAKNPAYGKKHTEEHKAYLREISLGEKNVNYGKKHSEESRKKMSESKKKLVGEKHPHFGKDLMKKETKKRFSEMYKGKPRKKPHDIVSCPHCGASGIKPNMIRWHFDNCKRKDTKDVDKLS